MTISLPQSVKVTNTMHSQKFSMISEIRTLFLFLCVSVLCFVVCATKPENPVVKTPVGSVRGSLMTSRLGKTIYSFRGVKYAKIPERFKQSEQITSWEGIFDASEEGPSCYQHENSTAMNMSEDCLALNIYTNELQDEKGTVKKPVLVFFHPGAFYMYSGQSFVFGPQYFLDQDIVLVTVNYRLGALGWISTGDHRAPGNLGLKDQVIALKFIRDNIAAFGGDPNSVTISGYSAGGWSVVLHIVSPMSKGLFHRAIVMSGSPCLPEKLPYNQTDLAIKQAKFLDCPTDDMDEMFKCLKEKSAEEFAKSRPRFNENGAIDPLLSWTNYVSGLVWAPVVEPEIPGVERFLPEHPEDLLKKKQFSQVPVITGIVKDEFDGVITIFIQSIKNGYINESVFDEANQDWERIGPRAFQYQRDTERSKYISKELRSFYFKDQPISLKNIEALGWLYTDAHVGTEEYRFAQLMAAYSSEPVYFYHFKYQGRYSYALWDDTKKPFGVVHQDDLMYFFYMSFIFPYFEKDAPEIPTVDRMTSMWAHFAKTGKPIPEDHPLLKDVVWEPFSPSDKKYLEIDEQLTMKSNLYAGRLGLWDRLYPLNITSGIVSRFG